MQHLGRCIAPDLIGMEESAKLPDPGPGTYSFATHARSLDALPEEVQLDGPVTLVLHDWGSALGSDWAARHPDAVRGIAFTEAIVTPLIWVDWPRDAKRVFRALRGPDDERRALEENVFVEKIGPASVLRGLSGGARALPGASLRARRPVVDRYRGARAVRQRGTGVDPRASCPRTPGRAGCPRWRRGSWRCA